MKLTTKIKLVEILGAALLLAGAAVLAAGAWATFTANLTGAVAWIPGTSLLSYGWQMLMQPKKPLALLPHGMLAGHLRRSAGDSGSAS